MLSGGLTCVHDRDPEQCQLRHDQPDILHTGSRHRRRCLTFRSGLEFFGGKVSDLNTNFLLVFR